MCVCVWWWWVGGLLNKWLTPKIPNIPLSLTVTAEETHNTPTLTNPNLEPGSNLDPETRTGLSGAVPHSVSDMCSRCVSTESVCLQKYCVESSLSDCTRPVLEWATVLVLCLSKCLNWCLNSDTVRGSFGKVPSAQKQTGCFQYLNQDLSHSGPHTSYNLIRVFFSPNLFTVSWTAAGFSGIGSCLLWNMDVQTTATGLLRPWCNVKNMENVNDVLN